MDKRLRFHGDGREPSVVPHADAPENKEPYITEDKLAEAVNLAIHLKRPLLLEGEAGCGKTKLAATIAYELGAPFYEWHVNSNTRINDGLYSFDTLGRLHDVQMQNLQRQTARDPDRIDDYISYGALGKAFRIKDRRAVVLIDEIDKAGIDFPNDLLTTIDNRYGFKIVETGETVAPKKDFEPIIIITSNREKGDLPEPFLRRCLYFYVKFPDPETLKQIIHIHYQVNSMERSPSHALIDKTVERFVEIRNETRRKKPGSSELLDWMRALQSYRDCPHTTDDIARGRPTLYPETLFKLKEDREVGMRID